MDDNNMKPKGGGWPVALLFVFFCAFYLGFLAGLVALVLRLKPALSLSDRPSQLIAGLAIIMAVYLAQAFIHIPVKNAARAPSGPAVYGAGFLLARSPLDLLFNGLARLPFPISFLGRLARLLTSPPRHLLRVFGYAFLRLHRRAHPPRLERPEAGEPAADETAKTEEERRLRLHLDRPVTLYAAFPEDLARSRADGLADLYPLELWELVDELDRLDRDRLGLKEAVRGQRGVDYLRIQGALFFPWELRREPAAWTSQAEALENQINAHHRRCRAAHIKAAERQGDLWADYLKSLSHFIHYAEHTRAALIEALRRFNGGAPKSLERLTDLLRSIYEGFDEIWLPVSFKEALPDMDAPPALKPDEVRAPEELAVLADLAVTELLRVENILDADGLLSEEPPLPPKAPTVYPIFDKAAPQPLRVDETAAALGVGFGRTALAVLVMAMFFWQGSTLGQSRLYIYNGLGRALWVDLDGRPAVMAPAFGRAETKIRPGREYKVTARSGSTVVETFYQKSSSAPAKEVYSIAGASPLMAWMAFYGRPRNIESRQIFMGRPRWFTTKADVVFQEPPVSVKDRGQAAYRMVLSGYGELSPEEMLKVFDDEKDRHELRLLHARWDGPYTRWRQDWQLALTQEEKAELAEEDTPPPSRQ